LEGEVEAERRAGIDELLGKVSDTSVPDGLVLADLISKAVNSEIRVGDTANIDHIVLVNNSSSLSHDTRNGELVGIGVEDFPLRDVVSIGDSKDKSQNEDKFHCELRDFF